MPRVARLRRVMWLGWLTGSVYFAATLYWIPEVLVTFGGLHRSIGVGAAALLVGFLALFPALSLAGTALAMLRWGPVGILWAPAFWVTGELARTYVFGGFPWVLLGYSQATVLPIAQAASVGGVYGLSGLVVLVAATGVYGVLASGRARLVVVASVVAAVLMLGTWGAWRLSRSDRLHAGTPIRVGLVQGNIAQEDKWDPGMRDSITERYLDMSREAAGRGAELILWPESATPFYFEEDRAGAAAVRQLASETGTHLIFGSDQVEREPTFRLYNAAFHVRPDGQTAEIYRKIHLVPFGEYVPFQDLLYFVGPLVDSVSHFSPGDVAQTMRIGDHSASTAICYEVVYPHLIGRFVDAGSELLTTITNDAWYGATSAPVQHFEQASVRAIEQGRYLLRAANTGISGIVDPYGRVVARSEIFVPDTIVADVRFLDAPTVYGRIGDLFAYVCAVLSAIATAVSIRRMPRAGSPRSRLAGWLAKGRPSPVV